MTRDITLRGTIGQYTLRIGTNALCRLEEYTGKSFAEALSDLQSAAPSMRLIRYFVKATLVMPDNATLDEVGAIIDDIGGLDVLATAISQQAEAAVLVETAALGQAQVGHTNGVHGNVIHDTTAHMGGIVVLPPAAARRTKKGTRPSARA